MWNQQFCDPVKDDDYASNQERAQDMESLQMLNQMRNRCFSPGMSYPNPQNFIVDGDGYVVVYTDGACPLNGRFGATAGIGVWFGHGHHL